MTARPVRNPPECATVTQQRPGRSEDLGAYG